MTMLHLLAGSTVNIAFAGAGWCGAKDDAIGMYLCFGMAMLAAVISDHTRARR